MIFVGKISIIIVIFRFVVMEGNNFQGVFTRQINTANVATAKAEDKLLQDEQYIPPSGHISLLKGKVIDGGAGQASMLTLGGVRMGDSRTAKFARELSVGTFLGFLVLLMLVI